MNFFNQIKESIYSPTFYSNIAQKTFFKALGYFLLLALLLTVTRSLVLIIPIASNAQNEATKILNEAARFYPQDMVVKINKGQVNTNVQEPYFIPISKSDGSASTDNILVIDTKTSFSISQFNQYKATA